MLSMSGAVVIGIFLLLVWLEWRRPLRRRRELVSRRLPRNLAVAALSLFAVRLGELPIVMPLARVVEARGWGLLGLVALPSWAAITLAIVLMDYTLYLWHVLTHRVPWLWRFHVVHHIDRDLDASTALRFHFAELLISVPWRAAQIALIGVGPTALAAWQAALMLSILFHHSNLRLPIGFERWLSRVIVTPRLHGIHHSTVREETDSNWSSGLTLWDRLHGTLRLNVPQERIEIGVPAYASDDDVAVGNVLLLPFVHQRQSWQRPNGERPLRDSLPATDELVA
jgi:sterol desaturase/sphingolipid hydroxylase (fatty acid hydroxylase superfamily)